MLIETMNTLIESLQDYLRHTLGSQFAGIRKWADSSRLPRYLMDRYVLYYGELFDRPYLIMLLRDGVEPTPTELLAQVRTIERRTDLVVLYIQTSIQAYQRQRLIEQKIPFVVPGNQLYLPPLGLDLREYYRTRITEEEHPLSPSAQLVLIGSLVKRWPRETNATNLARSSGYSDMTISRIKRELQSHGLLELKGDGRQPGWVFPFSPQARWEKSLPFLRSPVKRRLHIPEPTGELLKLPLAGLSALADSTLLNPPGNPVRAIGEETWRALNKKAAPIRHAPFSSDGSMELEIWKYEPSLTVFSGKHPGEPGDGAAVDPFSLYLSLRENKDERVEAALDELMESGLHDTDTGN